MRTILSLFWVLSNSAFAVDSDCIVSRVAFDIGSSKTAVKVATVDRCLQKIVRRFEPKSEKGWARKVSYKEALDSTKAGPETDKVTFPQAVRDQGIAVLKDLKKEAEIALADEANIEFSAVATAAFRTAAAADKERGRGALSDFLSQIEKETGLKVRILSQQEEGEVGFLAAASRAPDGVKLEALVVWDIGGSSQQITTYRAKKFEVYQGQTLASVAMKETVLEKIFSEAERKAHGVTAQGLKTPNPIGNANSDRAVAYAQEIAEREVPAPFKERLRTGYVMGIGGVHGISVRKQVSSATVIDPEALGSALSTRADLDDDQVALLNSPDIQKIEDPKARAKALESAKMFVETDVTNLALVLGYMKGLGISKVHPLQADLGDGALIDERLWK